MRSVRNERAVDDLAHEPVSQCDAIVGCHQQAGVECLAQRRPESRAGRDGFEHRVAGAPACGGDDREELLRRRRQAVDPRLQGLRDRGRDVVRRASMGAKSSSTKNGLPPDRSCSSAARLAGTGAPAIASSWRDTSDRVRGRTSRGSKTGRRTISVKRRRSG